MIPFPDTARCAIRGTVGSTNLVNTLWFRNNAGVTLSSLADLADALDLWWAGEVTPIFNEAYIYREVTAYDMSVLDSFLVVNDDNTGANGDDTNAILPLNTAMTVTFQTNRRGRSFRGRNFLSGFSEPAADARVWSSGVMTSVDAAYEQLSDFVGDVGWQHVVASQQNLGVPLTVGIVMPVVSYRPNARVYRQGNRTK